MIGSACLIFNPTAGQNDPDSDLSVIREHLETELDLDIQLTTPQTSAEQLAHRAVEQGVDVVIASGGDGTLSAVASALVGTEIPLGIISRGTANALASALQLPDSIAGACKTILAGTTRVIDVARCNDKFMVLLAGIGFEAETIEETDREKKKLLGPLAYVLSGIRELRELSTFAVEIATEDKVIQLEAVAVTVANLAPATSILAQGTAGTIADDGLLDVTIVSPRHRRGAIAASYHLLQTALRHDHTEREDIGYFRTHWVKVTTNPPQKVVLDGELIGTTPIEVECLPQCLTVCVPPPQSDQPPEKLAGLPKLSVKPKSQLS